MFLGKAGAGVLIEAVHHFNMCGGRNDMHECLDCVLFHLLPLFGAVMALSEAGPEWSTCFMARQQKTAL